MRDDLTRILFASMVLVINKGQKPMNNKHLTAAQLRRLADIKDEITALESEFNTISTTGTPVSMPGSEGFYPKGGKFYSDKHFTKELPNPLQLPLPKRRRKMSAAVKAKISAAAKNRWRKAWAAGRNHI